MISAYPALAQRQRFCAAARTLRALARRCLLYQPPRILFFLCSLLDGCSRSIVHWELREAMTEADVEIILQRGLEKYPHAKARIISDNGPQFFARDFKKFIRIAGLTHVRTSPQLSAEQREDRALAQVAQSWLHPPWSPQDARRLVSGFVEHYNTVRLHSAIGYITPADKLAGKEEAIFAARDQTPPGPERPIKLDVTKSTPTH